MKVIAIGDIHGRPMWEDIVNKHIDEVDKVIFVGDYFDSRDNYSASEQIDNFNKILEVKKQHPDKVILLIGNHDFHYLRAAGYDQYSGFQRMHAVDIREVLETAVKADLMQMAYQHNNYIFVHAGITKTWCQNNEIDMNNPVDSINELFRVSPESFRFTTGEWMSPYGDEICQTPIWVRPRSLSRDGIDDYVQVIGHTTQDNLTIIDNMILIDTLGTSGEFLIISSDKPTAEMV